MAALWKQKVISTRLCSSKHVTTEWRSNQSAIRDIVGCVHAPGRTTWAQEVKSTLTSPEAVERLCCFPSPFHGVFLSKRQGVKCSGGSEKSPESGSVNISLLLHQVLVKLVQRAALVGSHHAPLEMLSSGLAHRVQPFSFHATTKLGNTEGKAFSLTLRLDVTNKNMNAKFKMADTWHAMH